MGRLLDYKEIEAICLRNGKATDARFRFVVEASIEQDEKTLRAVGEWLGNCFHGASSTKEWDVKFIPVGAIETLKQGKFPVD